MSRKTRTKRQAIAPYRSMFEKICSNLFGKLCDYEPKECVLQYTVTQDKKYIPDFVPKTRNGIVIECKGRFRTMEEANKYLWIRKSNPDVEVVFVFQEPKVPMPCARARKDGSKMSHAEWAEKNDFRWYTKNTIPKEILR